MFFFNVTQYVSVLCRVFGTSMVEEYEEIADSQYLSERLEYLDEDYGKMPIRYVFEWSLLKDMLSNFFYTTSIADLPFYLTNLSTWTWF